MMLVQDFLLVHRSYEDVRMAFAADPHALIDRNAAAAYNEGELLCLQLQPLLKHVRFGKKVWVDIGDAYFRTDGLVLPVHWWAKGATHLFPTLDGDLEVMPFGESNTQLTFSGRYEPPLGGIGRSLDRMLLHRVAEASIRSFLKKLA